MKVLMLNVNGISGSTGKIVTDIKNVLESKGHECLICYGANDNLSGNGYIRICRETERRVNAAISSVSGIPHGKFSLFSFFRFKKIVEAWKPDIVHIHCPNGYTIDLFKTLEYLATSNIKTVLTNHAEYFYTGGCGYSYECEQWKTGCVRCHQLKSKIGLNVAKIEWNAFRKAFNRFKTENLIVTSVSPWVNNRVLLSPSLNKFENRVVLNGIDTEIFRIRDIQKNVQARLPKDKPIVLHVTASFNTDRNSIKGGYWIKEIAESMPDINFVVACSFQGEINRLPENVYIWGRTQNQIELAELYNAANVTLLTSKRETFSMIVAESLCCGTPIVGFKAGGPESIGIIKYSNFVDYGDSHSLITILNQYIRRNNKRCDISRQSIEKYSKENMTVNYLNIYNELISQKYNV